MEINHELNRKKTQSKLTTPGMYTSDETISKENQLVRLLIFFRLWSLIGGILFPTIMLQRNPSIEPV